MKHGVTFSGLLFIAFLTLKLTGVIAWSWWWITAPIWIPFLISVILVIVFFWLVGYYSKAKDN
jgi:predicted PurR-regulated permease PerM